MYHELIYSKVLSAGLSEKVELIYHSFFKYVGEYFTYIYLHILAYFLFLYALSELQLFKRYFLPKNASFSSRVLQNQNKIDVLIHHYFDNGRLYKDPLLTLESCAKTFNITKKELMDYFKLTNKGSFKDFVNSFRIEEIKQLIDNEEFGHYNIVGLAKECGFKSKSTFFRVFKDIEGITPNEFKKSKIEDYSFKYKKY